MPFSPVAGLRVKRHARAGRIAHVAEDHSLYVDRRTPVTGDVVHTAVHIGARVVPGTEDGLDRFQQLRRRFLRKFFALGFPVDGFEALYQFLHVVYVEVDVVADTFGFLDFVDDLFKPRLGDFHDDVREHLDEAAVRIVRKPRVLRLFCQALDRYIVQAQVGDRVHHARHGHCGHRCGPTRGEDRPCPRTSARSVFQPPHGLENLPLDFVGNPLAGAIIVRASFCRNGKALGDRQSQVRHFRQVCTFAAQQFAHLGVTFKETIDPFFACAILFASF
jgi:hypothetical protein